MMMLNIMVSAKPLYRVEDWPHDYLDGIGEVQDLVFAGAKCKLYMAEREGFEPSEPLRVHLISSQARSATPASLLKESSYATSAWHIT